MKYLTKDYIKKVSTVRILNSVKASDCAETTDDFSYYIEYKKQLDLYLKIAEKERGDTFDKEYEIYLFGNIIQNRQVLLEDLPKDVLNRLCEVRFLSLGFCRKKDLPLIKKSINNYIDEIDRLSEAANYFTESAIDCLPIDIELDFWADGILLNIYSKNGNYYMQFLNKKTLCIKNGEFLERESTVINRWDIDDVYSSWTKLLAAELYYKNKKFYLHCLFENRDMYERVKFWQLILKGDDVFSVND